MTPLQEAEAVLRQVKLTYNANGGTTPTGAAERLLLVPKLVEALNRMAAFHAGYRADTLVISQMVKTLLAATLASTNGELKWASELPPGKAPEFRRALANIVGYVKQIERRKND